MYALLLLLASPDYAVRQKAQHALVYIYPLSAPVIIQGRFAKDAEVRHRCDLLFKRYIHRDLYRIVAWWVLATDYDFPYDGWEKLSHWTGEQQVALIGALEYLTGRSPIYNHPCNAQAFNVELGLYRHKYRTKRDTDR